MQQVDRVEPHRLGQFLEVLNRDVRLPTFDGTDVRPVDSRPVTELLLRQLSRPASLTDVDGDAATDRAGGHTVRLR
jgi:hypothetical protein